MDTDGHSACLKLVREKGLRLSFWRGFALPLLTNAYRAKAGNPGGPKNFFEVSANFTGLVYLNRDVLKPFAHLSHLRQ